VEHFLSDWGYLALLILTIAEAAAVPIPSEVTLGAAGYLAAQGHMRIVPVILLATAGEVIGSFIGYAIGRTGGRALVERYGKYVLLTKGDLDRAEGWFDRHGEPTVLIGRMLPIVRTFVALTAGVAEMNLVRFGIFTAIGSGIWCTAIAVAGYELAGSWHQMTKGFSIAGYVLLAVAVVVIGLFIAHRYAAVRREQSEIGRESGSVAGVPGRGEDRPD
jgi:membrane protein DedA with SNARE-associated domain